MPTLYVLNHLIFTYWLMVIMQLIKLINYLLKFKLETTAIKLVNG